MKTSRLAATANPSGVARQRALASPRPVGQRKTIPTGRYFYLGILSLGFVLLSQAAQAAAVKLAWDANPESDISGYLLSYGTSPGSSTATLATGKVTNATVSGLEEGKTYYFTLKAVNASGLQSDPSAEISHRVPTSASSPSVTLIANSGWSLVSASSQETAREDGRAINAFDGNPGSIWHSQWSSTAARPPHTLTLDLGSSQSIQGFRYLPRQDGGTNGHIAQFEFHLSADGVNWGSPVAAGSFANNASEKEVLFPASSGRYIRLTALSDGSGGGYCAVAELKLIQGTPTALPSNQAPVAASQSVTTAEDTACGITLAATDADGDLLSYRVISQPSRGALSGIAPNLTYTPHANVNGSDSFSFVANDGKVDSNIAAVSITIAPVNDAPIAASQTVSATAGIPAAIQLGAADIDGDALTFTLVSNPAMGTLSGNPPDLTYTPDATASGSDSFTFRANDGSLNSNTATVTIQITPAPQSPAGELIANTGWTLVSASSQETRREDGRATHAFDGKPGTYWHSRWSNSMALPPHEIRIDLGKAESIRGFRYLPRQDGGTRGNIGQFEFHLSTDGVHWGSPVASGTFPNQQDEKEVLFPAKTARYILLRALSDASGGSSCCVAELKLLQGPVDDSTPPPNEAPVAASQPVTTLEDQAVQIQLSATDANGDTLTYHILSQPGMGTLSGTAPNLTYTPYPDANGSDSFTFRAHDGTTDSNTATISITVTPVNDAPVAENLTATTLEDRSVGILIVASDKDGDPLTYSIVSPPGKGRLSGVAPILTYTPDPDVNGTDSFTFQAHDGSEYSNTATVMITITAVNDAPTAASQFVTTDADKPVGILLSAMDKDGDELTYSVVSQPVKGVLSGTAPNLTYTPNPAAAGSDSFSFRAHDGTEGSNTATISITLVAVVDPDANEAPEFQFEIIRRSKGKVGEDYTCSSLAGVAVDPEGDPVTYARVAGPEWLTVGPDGSLHGTPTEGSEGLNTFTIRAMDPKGAYSEASLDIEVESGGLPLPWTLEKIGSVHEQADAFGDSLAIQLLGSGTLKGSSDSGLLAWQTLTGDGAITVRLRDMENADTATRIGLMIRESLAPNSKHTFIGTDGRGYIRWIRRAKTGGSTSVTQGAVIQPLGVWLRLSRAGTTVSAFTSMNGTDWTRVGRVNVDLGTSCYIGLAVHSGSANKLSAAVFENIVVEP
jgi:hypothetical protein